MSEEAPDVREDAMQIRLGRRLPRTRTPRHQSATPGSLRSTGSYTVPGPPLRRRTAVAPEEGASEVGRVAESVAESNLRYRAGAATKIRQVFPAAFQPRLENGLPDVDTGDSMA